MTEKSCCYTLNFFWYAKIARMILETEKSPLENDTQEICIIYTHSMLREASHGSQKV
jgi:hypothetical protein